MLGIIVHVNMKFAKTKVFSGFSQINTYFPDKPGGTNDGL